MPPGGVAVPDPTYRLIAARFPPVPAFEDVAAADDLACVLELAGWTDDRRVAERMRRLPRADWVFGRANASVVMAAFLHAAPGGARFSTEALGAWYAATAERTAIAEVAHHLRREAVQRGRSEQRRTFRCYRARIEGADHVDLRGLGARMPAVYDRHGYAASQAFGEAAREAGRDGIVYDSVRHAGGTCVAGFRPRAVAAVAGGLHYDILAPVAGAIVARRLGV